MAKAQGGKSKERGSSDEVEILRDIIKNDPLLMEKVLDKMRQIRAISKVGVIDEMAKKQVSGEVSGKRKKS